MGETSLKIDGKKITVKEGTTVLDAVSKLGVEIPTLCHHPDLSIHGSCRICVVEEKVSGDLLASCVQEVREGMEILTHSNKVREARRMNIELLLSEHPNDCLGCDKNGSCELQQISFDLGVTDISFARNERKHPIDNQGPALKKEPAKCILCGRCVRACEEIQGVSALDFTNRGIKSVVTTAFNRSHIKINCANCGQCATVCPTAAITEYRCREKIWDVLEDEQMHVIVQTAPSIQSTIGEEFGMETGSVVTKKLATALRRLGFDKVFSTDFAADLTIMEEGNEFIKRLKADDELPHITSCCPGWVKFCEHNYHDLIENLSSAKSPMSMFSAVAKTYYAKEQGIDPDNIYTVAIMPCTAKKFEMNREELRNEDYATDAVLTTRELARLIKEMGINFATLEEQEYDSMLGTSTGAAAIFGTTGGVTEAALRTVKENLTGEDLEPLGLSFNGINEAEVKIGDREIKAVIANGLKNASKILDKVKSGAADYDFIEIMAFPKGCVGGGGQPFPSTAEIKNKRGRGLRNIDQNQTIRKSHENPEIKKIYQDYLGKPLSGYSHHLLHTSYQRRKRN